MRILGLDVGEKNIGVAISDDEGRIALPRETIRRESLEKDVARLARLAQSEGVEEIVVGMPLSMDGREGPQARKVLEFMQALRRSSGLQVTPWDERLSTVAANRALLEGDLSRARRRQVVDKVAAALVLQGYLDYRRSKEGPGQGRA